MSIRLGDTAPDFTADTTEIVIDDKVVPVVGPGVPFDHDSHGPGGMCMM